MTPDPPLAESNQKSLQGWQLAACLLGVLLVVIGINYAAGRRTTSVGSEATPTDGALATDAATGVTLVREEARDTATIIVVHRRDMTVLDAMTLAASADANWQFSYQGSGAAAFLTELGGRNNQGAAGLNWQYEVNGQRADVSFGICPLEPGDRVLWKFAPYE